MSQVDGGVITYCMVGGAMIAVPLLSMLFVGYSAVKWVRAPRTA